MFGTRLVASPRDNLPVRLAELAVAAGRVPRKPPQRIDSDAPNHLVLADRSLRLDLRGRITQVSTTRPDIPWLASERALLGAHLQDLPRLSKGATVPYDFADSLWYLCEVARRYHRPFSGVFTWGRGDRVHEREVTVRALQDGYRVSIRHLGSLSRLALARAAGLE